MRAVFITSDGCRAEMEVPENLPSTWRRGARQGPLLGEPRCYELERVERVAIYRERPTEVSISRFEELTRRGVPQAEETAERYRELFRTANEGIERALQGGIAPSPGPEQIIGVDEHGKAEVASPAEEPLVDTRERELRAEREAEADARMRERSRRGGVS